MPRHRTGKTVARSYLEQAQTPGYPDHWSGPPEIVDRLVEELAVRPQHRVLDVGCGVGGPARRVASITDATVYAIDPLTEVVADARRRTRAGCAVRFAAADAEALPFPKESFDGVLCLGVVAHLSDRLTFATEATRVLRPGGWIAVTEVFWAGTDPPRFRASAPQPWQPVAVDVLADELARAGLEDVRERPWPGRETFRLSDVSDDRLRSDLTERRLLTAMVTARKPG